MNHLAAGQASHKACPNRVLSIAPGKTGWKMKKKDKQTDLHQN
jgi:hypothetical protein